MVQPRTMANLVEREGEAIATCVENKAKTILKCHDFTDEGVCTGDTSRYGLLTNESVLSKERVSQAGKELNDMLPKERQIDVESLQDTFENPMQVKALISVDDVLCKKQKVSGRKKGSPPPKKKERVKNTVAHILAWEGRNLHGDDRHDCADDDGSRRFSALKWAHAHRGTRRLFHGWG
jgi:hypothetical protein